MSDSASMLRDERERIALDLHELVRVVLLVDRPDGVSKAQDCSWRWRWLMALVWGYCQTDLGVSHASGEDASGWREDAAKHGLDVRNVRGLTFAEWAREDEQRRLYAEAMAPKLAAKMVASMREEPSE